MKKYFLVVFCVLLLFVVTGCGGNQLKCTGTMEESGQKVEAELIAEFDKDDKLTTVTMISDVGDKTQAEQVCAMYNAFSSQMPEGVSVSCSGSKVTIKGYEKMQDEDEESVVGKTKEEFKKQIEEESEGQFTCK